jgi:hypothetical protein
VLRGKLLVCGKSRAAVQRNSLQSYRTVIIQLCNVMHFVGIFAITKEQKHTCQYCMCVKIEDCWLTERAVQFHWRAVFNCYSSLNHL